MLHTFKRHVANVSSPLRFSPNAEFADLRQRLTSVKTSLKYTLQTLTAANRHWVVQIQDQRRFSDRFAQAYPTPHDDTHTVALQFASGSQALYDKFSHQTAPDLAVYQHITHQLSVYLNEIHTVEASYRDLAMAHSETERYQAKLDAMQRSKRPVDPTKRARNVQKLHAQRQLYTRLLEDTIANQKRAYAKHPIVFKAALTAYWLSHENHVNMLVRSLEHTQQFAKAAEPEMMHLDIANWAPAEPTARLLSAGHVSDVCADPIGRSGACCSDTLQSAADEFAQPASPVYVTVESPKVQQREAEAPVKPHQVGAGDGGQSPTAVTDTAPAERQAVGDV